MDGNEHINYFRITVNLVFSIIATGVVILVGAWGLVYFMPFIIGWVIALMASPVVRWLERRLKIVRKIGSAITIVIVLALMGLLIYLIGVGLFRVFSDFFHSFPKYYESLGTEFQKVQASIEDIIEHLPAGVASVYDSVINSLDQYTESLINLVSEPTMSFAGNVAKSIPSILISGVMAILASYFFIADREIVISYVKKIMPISIQSRMTMVNSHFKHAVGGYFLAQLKIMGVIFAVLWISFMLLGVRYHFLVALLIAVLDFFPVLGTGTIMIPWALFQVLSGDYRMALVLAIIYVGTQALRNFIQPKLVADSIGMNPIVTLLLIYIGYKVDGVIGMIIAIPIGMIVINLVEAGAFDYIIDDVKILGKGIVGMRDLPEDKSEKE